MSRRDDELRVAVRQPRSDGADDDVRPRHRRGDARRIERVPLGDLHPRRGKGELLRLLRATAVTWWPRDTASRAMRLPIVPPAPNRAIFMLGSFLCVRGNDRPCRGGEP